MSPRFHTLPPSPVALAVLLALVLAPVGCVPPPESADDATVETMRCNGHRDLCDRALDQVVFPATHNSMSHADADWWRPNQPHGLTRQLEDGIRGFLLDVLSQDGELMLCHGFCDLGSQPLSEGLAELVTFLRQRPHEVLVIIFQDEVPADQLDAALVESGLADMAYAHTPGEAFPTLGEMVRAGQRILMTLESGAGPAPYLHHVWDLFSDTPYAYTSVAEFSCEAHRGDPDHPLFLLNHWIGDAWGLPSPDFAPDANAFDLLFGRATQCRESRGRVPNLVAVDFYTTGDLFAVIDALNGL